MKKVFFRMTSFWIMFFFICSFVLEIFFICELAIEINQGHIEVVLVVLNICYPFILFLLSFFLRKKLFSRIILSAEGVKLTFFKKQLLFFKWNEITEVKQVPYTTGFRTVVVLCRGAEIISFDITPKVYKTIMILCSIPWIKTSIRNLGYIWDNRKAKYDI
jgi:hypothetical protein